MVFQKEIHSKTYGTFVMTVSEEDKDLLEFKWSVEYDKKHERFVGFKRNGKQGNKTIYTRLHRIILFRMLNRSLTRKDITDHIDGDVFNNIRENLRLAPGGGNQRNIGKPRDNTSGYKGVTWHKKAKKWVSQIRLNGKIIYLGLFTCKLEAAKAYNEAALKYHGDFARLNEIEGSNSNDKAQESGATGKESRKD